MHACLPFLPHALTCLIQQRPGIMSSWKHTIKYSKYEYIGGFSAFPKQFFRRQWLNCSWIYTKWNNRQKELFFFVKLYKSCFAQSVTCAYISDVTNSTARSPWEANSCSLIQEIPRILWNPEGLLLCLQEPTTGPYPEPDKSTQYLPSYF
jgi:hypothetical protein